MILPPAAAYAPERATAARSAQRDGHARHGVRVVMRNQQRKAWAPGFHAERKHSPRSSRRSRTQHRCHDLSLQRASAHEVSSFLHGIYGAIASDGTCRAAVWSKGWIPFVEDGSQNYLCIDLDPGPRGKAGQVVRWKRSSNGADATE